MQKNSISTKQAVCILLMFILGNTLTYSGSKAKQDNWLAFLIAAALSVPMMLAYARIVSLYPGQNLYDIVIAVFGKIFGKAITLLFALYAIHLGAVVMRSLSEYIRITAMQETTQLITLIFLFGLGVWMTKSGVATLGKWAAAILPSMLVVLVVMTLISVRFWDFSHLKPVTGISFNTLMESAFALFSFPFAESVLFLTLFGSVKGEGKPFKIYFWGLGISIIFFLIADIRNLLVFGPGLSEYYFPAYIVISVISLGEFFTRIDVLVSLAIVLDTFVKLCVCMVAAAAGLSKLFNQKGYKDLAVPAGLLMLTLAGILYSNTIEMYDWLEAYKYYAFPFQVILPLVILAGAEIKTRAGKRLRAEGVENA